MSVGVTEYDFDYELGPCLCVGHTQTGEVGYRLTEGGFNNTPKIAGKKYTLLKNESTNEDAETKIMSTSET